MRKNMFDNLVVMLFFMAFIVISCKDDVIINSQNKDKFEYSAKKLASIINDEGKQNFTTIEFSKEHNSKFYLNAPKSCDLDVSGNFIVDAELLKKYNADYSSNYEILPSDAYELIGGFTLKKGEIKSSAADLKLKSIKSLKPNKTYVLPLKVNLTSGKLVMSEKNNQFLLFINDITKLPNANKKIKFISCTGINPLNHLGVTLKNSNKLMVDMIIMFSAGMKINPESGRIYLYLGGKFKDYFSQRDKYFKPLQDRGVKIIVSILGAREICGISNLSDETAKEFAKELKRFCDSYKLDGVFFDDEYSAYVQNYPFPEGYVKPSVAAASRLVYETKKALPNKLVTVYGYSNTSRLVEIDGTQPGDYIDFAIGDYGDTGWRFNRSYPGLSREKMSVYSQEFAQGRFADDRGLGAIVSGGYGANMIFSFNPFYNNWNAQKDALKRTAEILYKDEVVFWDKSNWKK